MKVTSFGGKHLFSEVCCN